MSIDKGPLNKEELRQEWEIAKKQTLKDTDAQSDVWNRLLQTEPSIGKAKVIPMYKRVSRWVAASAAILLLVVGTQFLLQPKSTFTGLVEKTNNTKFPISISLEDGSSVSLKPNSQLVYNQPFTEEGRKVFLKGEARFDISTDSLNPFIVETNSLQTTVLGTIFNIKAPTNKEETEVLLFEGKVEVSKKEKKGKTPGLILQPGERAQYKKSTRQLSKNHLFEDSDSKWKDGVILFRRANIEEVVITLEEWYDVSIAIDNNAKITDALVHRIDTKKMSLEEAVNGINLVAKYEITKTENNEYFVSLKE